ncbi:MAG: hypothetical protein A2156_08670 [Deltaproteobacteria bacterium RBG_16_48_10]|nr:MAG: hypothetical protein A2156_08670 [Deltaproteobacteria bacterium RBG_16_48_10]
MNPLVIVSKGEDPYQATKVALQQFSLPTLKGRKVLVKPNAARLAFPGQGVTTHPSVVEATIDHFKESGAIDIVIGESCIFGVNAQDAFQVTGMKKVSEKEGVKLIDLDCFDPVEIALPKGGVIKKIKVPSIFKQFDFIISIPVMKTHMHTQVTLSIKNMKGLLWRKEKARFHHLRCDEKVTKGHRELDMAISEMASALFPHFAIIDGTVGMEGMGPAYGNTKKMGIIVVGNDPLSADAVATRLMGFDPEKVPHLKLSAEKGLGEIELEKISVKPDNYLRWETPFNPPPYRLSIPFPDIVVHDEGSCSACLSTLLVFLQNYYPQLSDCRLQDGKIHIGIGKHLNRFPKGTILIGNCSSKMKRKGIFIQGCPPVASQIWNTLSQRKHGKNFLGKKFS